MSDTALVALVASKLGAIPSERKARDRWLKHHLSLRVRSNGLERAAKRAAGNLHPWWLVDPKGLGMDLECSLVVFPGRGRPRPKLLSALRKTGAVRQLLVARSRRDVLCVLLHWADERERLFAELDGFGEPMVWEEVLEEDRGIESIAWQTLARRRGEAEGFLTESEPGALTAP